jgi:hypothetical protein
MIPLITSIEPMSGLRLKLTFDNGETIIVSFRKMFTPVWLPQYSHPETFNQVTITADKKAVTWFGFVTVTAEEILNTRPDLSIEEEEDPEQSPADNPDTPDIDESIPWWKKLFGG